MRLPKDIPVFVAFYSVKGDNKLQSKHIERRGLSPYSHENNNFSTGDAIRLIDLEDERDGDMPLYAKIRGFYGELAVTQDDHVVHLSYYRKLEGHERYRPKLSEYPYTCDLRDYLNWKSAEGTTRSREDMQSLAHKAIAMRDQYCIDVSGMDLALFKNLANRGDVNRRDPDIVPPHLHWDDFSTEWMGHIKFGDPFNMRGHNSRYEPFGMAFINGKFEPARRDTPLRGMSTFQPWERDYYGSDKLLMEAFFSNKPGPKPELYAKLDRESITYNQDPVTWDPVSDFVKVEKIVGNISFLSEFGYICTMSCYQLITNEERLRIIL